MTWRRHSGTRLQIEFRFGGGIALRIATGSNELALVHTLICCDAKRGRNVYFRIH